MRMNRILDIDYADRCAVVQAGVTNIGITTAVAPHGFFYAPDPSSQLACMIGGNVAMNLRRRALPALRRYLQQPARPAPGHRHRRDHRPWRYPSRRRRLRLARPADRQRGPARRGHRGRGADPARPRGCPCHAGRIPLQRGRAGARVDAIIGSGIIPVALEFMDRPAIHACEELAHAGYPLDAEAMLIIECGRQHDRAGRAAGAHPRDLPNAATTRSA